ncbi:cupin domain-containing protein [Candidatus Bathyarchaeota archaeon]|nr:cupin domain-containing protein [Candidatus Bathyarchaeota archaeon]
MVKIIKVAETPLVTQENSERISLVNEEMGAKNFSLSLLTVKPNTPPVTAYHSHKKQENGFFIIRGKAKMIVEGEEYIVEPMTMVFASPGEKHQVINIGKSNLEIMAIHAPVRDD